MLNDFCHRNLEMRGKIFKSFLFLATVITLSFAWQKTSALSNSGYSPNILLQSAAYSSLPLLHLPGEHTAVFVTPEFLAEEETDNNFNPRSTTPADNTTPLITCCSAVSKNQHLSYSSFLAEYSPVPLFVLYHSWKSFVA